MQIMENWGGKKIKSYSVEEGKEGKKNGCKTSLSLFLLLR